MSNGSFGALAEGLQAGFGMRQAYKQRKLDQEMDRLNREDRTKKAALDEAMQRQGMEARLREITNGENATKWQQDQTAKEFAARQDTAFAGASPQAQQMMLKGNQPVGVGIFAPGAGPADVQRFQERMPLVQQRIGQEEEDRARTIEAQQADARNHQSDSAARWLAAINGGRGGSGRGQDNSIGYTDTIGAPDEDGNVTRTRIKLMRGQEPPPTPQAAAPVSPELAQVNAAIAEQQKRIGDNRVQQAMGDNRTGFLNYRSRDSEIADAQQKLANLQRGMPGAPTNSALPIGVAPATQAPANPQAAAALQWARANPNDPRSAAILQKLGQR